MTLFWDRKNQPIEDTIEWAKKFEDVAYREVAVDSDGMGQPMVSTIWNGMDRSLNLHVTDDTAMIFETAYLVNGHIEQTWLANTEQEALVQHEWVCMNYLRRHARPEDGLMQRIIDAEKEARAKE